MLAMIPTQLTYTKEAMSNSLKEMYSNLNYFYKLTGPLHNHKTYDKQMQQIKEVTESLVNLSRAMDGIKDGMGGYENRMYDNAHKYI